MTITFLMALAGALAADASGVSSPAVQVGVEATRPSPFGPTFTVAPVLGSRFLRAVQPFGFAPPLKAGPTSTAIVQLQNPRTGVTCAMRILEVKPAVDPGMIRSASEPHPDPIVRNSSSPCVE